MFEASINDMESGAYLGDTKIVSKLVAQFIDSVVTARNVNEIMSTINQYSEIFLGLGDTYRVVDGWNTADGLGRVLARRLSVAHTQSSADLFRSAFGVFARDAMTIVKMNKGKSDSLVEAEVTVLRKYMIACLMGTVDTLYPEGKSWK